MNAVKALAHGTSLLTKAGISTARLDTLVLLEDITHRGRAWILAHPEEELTEVQIGSLNRRLKRRATHLPLAYVRGHSEFYGRKFKVNRHVLEPRPESETMIELLKELVDSAKLIVNSKPETTNYKLQTMHSIFIADVGTGSGALGITAALEISGAQVDLFDISSAALGVAKHNTQLHELHLQTRKMDLLSRPSRPYDVVLANLPYVPDSHTINQAAMFEPKIAIFGGADGLDLYRRLFGQLAKQPARYVLTESLPPQHKSLAAIAKNHGYKLIKTQDFIQVFEIT